MLKEPSFYFYLLACLLLPQFIAQQSFPESINATEFPDQNQAIYGGWIVSNESTGSVLFYNIYSRDGTDFNSSSNGNGNDNDNDTTPLMMIIEGGPASPGLLSAFAEIGPYQASLNLTTNQTYLIPNPNSWTQHYHLLILDQQIGAGFSIAGDNETISSSNQAADHLLTFLIRFYDLYPNARNFPLYINGRSYGGKFTLLLASKIRESEQLEFLDLGGVILTNALVNPTIQGKRADFLYFFGLINQQERNYLRRQESKMDCFIQRGKYVSATKRYLAQDEYLARVTGGVFLSNVLLYNDPQLGFGLPLEYTEWAQSYVYLADTNSSYRSIFSIPSNLSFSFGSSEATESLVRTGDHSRSVADVLESLLSQEVDVLINTAQLDGVITPVGISQYVDQLDWDGAEGFRDAEKSFLVEDGSVIGWYQKYRNLVYAFMNEAGHISTYDQPANMLSLVSNFTSGQF